MSVVLLSMWYGDAGKHLADRALHILQKPGVDRWCFSVRPTNDCTQMGLGAISSLLGKDESTVRIHIEEHEQPGPRLERLSLAGDNLLDMVKDEDYVLWHESDLFTDDDLVSRLVDTMERYQASVVGGWPMLGTREIGLKGIPQGLRMELGETIFYDIWGYRKDGVRFTNRKPHHECCDTTAPFYLDTVGSVVLLRGRYAREGARMNGGGLVGLCDAVRGMGGTVVCDPRVRVVQPVELWTFQFD